MNEGTVLRKGRICLIYLWRAVLTKFFLTPAFCCGLMLLVLRLTIVLGRDKMRVWGTYWY